MSDRTPPHDLHAEQVTLGAMLLSSQVAAEVERVVTDRDFYDPRHRRMFQVAARLRAAGKPADAVHVNAELQASGELPKLGATLVSDLIAAVPTAANGPYSARIVRDRAVLRAVIGAAERATQMAYAPGDEDAHDVAMRAADEMTTVRDKGMLDEDLPTMTLVELLDQPVAYDWLIPGLVERGDRVLLTGGEGVGKSYLARQIAVCAAAGLNPFTHKAIDPAKVLVIDCENGLPLSQRRYGPLSIAAKQAGHPVADGRMWLEIKPSGLDLASISDMRWLLRRVEVIQPDLLVIGPIYRLHADDPNDERSARKIAAVLDRARAESGCALLAETHSPHSVGVGRRPLRPLGSSLWLRWPEFGIGIRYADTEDAVSRRIVDVEHWRGGRDEREWPTKLRAGGVWPWVEEQPDSFRWSA